MQTDSTIKVWIDRLTGKDRAFNLAHAGKWTLYFVAIGLIAGLGSIVFHYLCQLGVHYFMDMVAGYRPPSPAGEHHLLTPTDQTLQPLDSTVFAGFRRIVERLAGVHFCTGSGRAWNRCRHQSLPPGRRAYPQQGPYC